MDPKAMRAAMKKMGMKQEEIPADEVIIRSPGKNLIIRNPQVMKVEMMGQESFQITGELVEQQSTPEFTLEDIKTVMEQAGVAEDAAQQALQESKGDLAQAIIFLNK